MLRAIVIALSIVFFSTFVSAQHYRTAAGIRLGNDKTIGLTVQQKIYDKYTLEGILQVGSGSETQNSLILLAEQHQKILFKRLNLYFGLGLHKSWYNNADSEPDFKNPSGLSGITGLEVAINRMTVSLDIQPNLNIFGDGNLLNTTTAVSLRYVIIKPKKKERRKINWRFWEKKDDGKKKKKKRK